MAANLVNIASVPAIHSTTEHSTSESKLPDGHLWPYLIKYFLVCNNSILYTECSTVLLKDGTIVELKSTAQVAHALLHLLMHDASVKQHTYADALLPAGAILALNQALVDPHMYILSWFEICIDTYPVVVKCRKWSSTLWLVDCEKMARILDISEVICGAGDRCAPIAFFKNMNHKWYSSNFNAVDVKLHHKMATIGFMKIRKWGRQPCCLWLMIWLNLFFDWV